MLIAGLELCYVLICVGIVIIFLLLEIIQGAFNGIIKRLYKILHLKKENQTQRRLAIVLGFTIIGIIILVIAHISA